MDNIKQAIETIKKGGTLLYPTDTIWGIGCDATNEEAVEKVIQLKSRGKEKSFIILVDSVNRLERLVPEFPEVCYDLIDFAIKPLTIIYEGVQGLAKNVLAADGSVGIRVTNDPICKKIIQGLNKPIVSTSANFSGEPSPTRFADIPEALKDKIDYILEERISEIRTQPSSVIKIGKNNSVQIIRK